MCGLVVAVETTIRCGEVATAKAQAASESLEIGAMEMLRGASAKSTAHTWAGVGAKAAAVVADPTHCSERRYDQ